MQRKKWKKNPFFIQKCAVGELVVNQAQFANELICNFRSFLKLNAFFLVFGSSALSDIWLICFIFCWLLRRLNYMMAITENEIMFCNCLQQSLLKKKIPNASNQTMLPFCRYGIACIVLLLSLFMADFQISTVNIGNETFSAFTHKTSVSVCYALCRMVSTR